MAPGYYYPVNWVVSLISLNHHLHALGTLLHWNLHRIPQILNQQEFGVHYCDCARTIWNLHRIPPALFQISNQQSVNYPILVPMLEEYEAYDYEVLDCHCIEA